MNQRRTFLPALRAWWREAGRAEHTVVVLGLAGFSAVLASMLPGPGPDDAWLRDLLMTVGASALLFVPFYAITRSLDRHLDRVAANTAQQVEGVRAETAQQVAEVRGEAARASAALTGQVEALRADVDRRLAEAAGGSRRGCTPRPRPTAPPSTACAPRHPRATRSGRRWNVRCGSA